VFFKTHTREGANLAEIEALDHRMYEIVSAMPGFLSLQTYTSDEGEEMGVVRFASEDALAAWRNHPGHRAAMKRGREEFYDYVWVQVCKVVRDYEIMLKGTDAMKETIEMAGSWIGPSPDAKARPPEQRPA
jgi:heme-degrading monooxygenase HmoA